MGICRTDKIIIFHIQDIFTFVIKIIVQIRTIYEKYEFLVIIINELTQFIHKR